MICCKKLYLHPSIPFFFFFSDCKWYYIFNFSVHMFIASIQENSWIFVFILYPSSLLNSLIGRRHFFFFFFLFWLYSSGFSIWTVISSSNRDDSFISSFPVCFICFCGLWCWLGLGALGWVRVLRVGSIVCSWSWGQHSVFSPVSAWLAVNVFFRCHLPFVVWAWVGPWAILWCWLI